MSLSFETYEAPMATTKRRYKVYKDYYAGKNADSRRARKQRIQQAELFKPHRRRAIARDRKMKYDECRGEEAHVDTCEEEFSSILSSRKACPFVIRKTIAATTIPEYINGIRVIVPWRSEFIIDIAKGTLYKSLTANENDITIIHRLQNRPTRIIAEGDFSCVEQDITDMENEEDTCELEIPTKIETFF